MVCAYCGSKTQVTNSRHQVKSNQVWRRRKCLKCHATFTSEETVHYELAWIVWDSAAFQPFSRDKLFLSIYTCCEHREHSLTDAQGVTATVMNKLPAYILHDTAGTLTRDDIARVTQVALNRFDKAAAVRYLSLHRRRFPVKPIT